MERWKALQSHTLVENPFLKLKHVHFRLPNGVEIPDYFILERGNYVLVVAQDEQGRILLEKQYRPGADDYVYELPAGWIDEGETAAQAAVRETKEEAGAVALSVRDLGSFYPLAGFIQEEAFALFITFDSSQIQADQQEEKEDIEILLVSEDELRQMIRSNHIKCMGSLAALTLFWNQ